MDHDVLSEMTLCTTYKSSDRILFYRLTSDYHLSPEFPKFNIFETTAFICFSCCHTDIRINLGKNMCRQDGIPEKLLLFSLLVFSLCMGSVIVWATGVADGEIMCMERERQALLRFKHGLTDEDGALSSWGGEERKKECCRWKGVVCSNSTYHVIGLQLDDAGLRGNISSALLDLHHLNSLDLTNNDFSGNEIPGFIGSFQKLQHLRLSNCSLSGCVPRHLGNLTNLKTLCLGSNRLKGLTGTNFKQLSKLEILDVSYNLLEGNISESHISNLHNLKVLNLSFSSVAFNMIITDWVPPFQLDALTLAACNLGPHFPKWVQTQRNVSHLDLSYNGISGDVPKWLWDLSPRLEYLNLSHNHLRGRLPDLSSKFARFPAIDFSFNKLSGSVPLFHPNSSVLQLSQNMLRGPISAICRSTYDYLGLLDLSNNQLSGELPNCSMNMIKLVILNLANNSISGKIPNECSREFMLEILVLRSNNLSGELPPNLKYCHQLKMLDVGGNQLSGSIPSWIGTDLTVLMFLILEDNKFHGIIPQELCYLTEILILDLSKNNISGIISRCFNDYKYLVESHKTPQRLRTFSGRINFFDGSGYDISYIDKVYVRFKGQVLKFSKTLKFLRLIDLSGNKLRGNIPKEFSLMRGLIFLNLSRNYLTGNIDSQIGQMNTLEYLDLSRNQLSGQIPVSLAHLTFLSFLDLSNNNLSGKIPSGTQLQSFDDASYAGNDGLCGSPLGPCLAADSPHPRPSNKGKHIKLDEGFYISMVCGYIFGFWGFVLVLFSSSWRHAFLPSGRRHGIGCM